VAKTLGIPLQIEELKKEIARIESLIRNTRESLLLNTINYQEY
jgi:ribosomal protein L29